MPPADTLRSPPPQAGQLLRVLGLAFAIAIGVGAVIGGGILRTPATVVASVPLIWLALSLWVIVGLHALLEANVIAELMTAMPRSGGLFVPARAAFKESGGLLVGWTDWLGWTAAAGALAILSAEFLAMIVPALEPLIVPVGAALLLALVALNWLGVREGSRVQIIGSAAKFAFLVGLVVLIFLSPGAPAETVVSDAAAPVTLIGVIVAYQIIFGAYAGWTSGAYFAEEDV
ncbi:MAG: amino acid permease, partial [Sphingomicrobium sp.]